LKLTRDGPLSKFAFNFNLRRYVWAPHAEAMTAVLLGDSSGGDGDGDDGAELMRFPMVRGADEDGANFRCEVPGIGGGARYHFEVTMPGGHSFARRDPWARHLEFDSDVATVVNPAAFEWSEFVCPAFDELVIYQVHVGTFTGLNDPETELAGVRPGSFAAAAARLDHVADMG